MKATDKMVISLITITQEAEASSLLHKTEITYSN